MSCHRCVENLRCDSIKLITELVGCRDVSWRSYQIYEADDDVVGQYVKNAVPYSVNMIISIGVEKRYCQRNFEND